MSLFSEISNIGGSLKNEALKQAGDFATGQTAGILSSVFGVESTGLKIPKINGVTASDRAIWSPTDYAAATIGRFGPKTKFLFRVKIEFNPEVLPLLASLGLDADSHRDFTYTVKSIDLPTIEFDYEDVNLYGFKTKILKSISHNDLQLSLYDDSANVALSTVMGILKLHSPLTRNQLLNTSYRTIADGALTDSIDIYDKTNTVSRAPLPNTSGINAPYDVINNLIIDQYFAPSASADDGYLRVNTFTFTNPKILRFDISNQDYAGEDGNDVSLTFNYDAINLTVNKGITDLATQTGVGEGFAKGDLLAPAAENPFNSQSGAGRKPGGKANNPFIDIIHQQSRNAIGKTISSTINNAVGSQASSIFGGAIGTLSGGLANAASKTIRNQANTAVSSAAGYASSTFKKIKDNATDSGG